MKPARVLLLLEIAAGILQAGQYLVVTRSSAGAWSFLDVESLSINGKERFLMIKPGARLRLQLNP
jgi:hypothetical protein